MSFLRNLKLQVEYFQVEAAKKETNGKCQILSIYLFIYAFRLLE